MRSVLTYRSAQTWAHLSQRTTGRGGSGNIRQAPLPSGECFKEDKVTSPSGREMKTGRGAVSRRSGTSISYLIQALTNAHLAGSHRKRWCRQCRVHLQATTRRSQGHPEKGEGDPRSTQAGDAPARETGDRARWCWQFTAQEEHDRLQGARVSRRPGWVKNIQDHDSLIT